MWERIGVVGAEEYVGKKYGLGLHFWTLNLYRPRDLSEKKKKGGRIRKGDRRFAIGHFAQGTGPRVVATFLNMQPHTLGGRHNIISSNTLAISTYLHYA